MPEQTRTASRIGEDRIREAFEYAASGMAITDLEGHFQETNPAYRAIVGRAEDELAAESIFTITDLEDRENCRNHLEGLVSGEVRSFVLDKRYVRPDSTTVWVRNSSSLLKDEHGAPAHVIWICNDITERLRAERLLAEREKLAVVGQLAASIAHEINNPLEAVLNLLYLVNESDDLAQAHQFAAQAESEIQRAAQIVTHTLQFHKEQIRPTWTDVGALLDSVLVLFKSKLALSGIKVSMEKRGQPRLICYSGEIRQVLANLVRNAMEAMPGGGTLRLRVRDATDWRTGTPGVRITVGDTGYGMPPQTRARIYEPFFTTKGSMGTGLGLWVTSGIIMNHRGSMHVRSREVPGKSGTAFTLIFPGHGAEGHDADWHTFSKQ